MKAGDGSGTGAPPPTVLIVDDVPQNLAVLHDTLLEGLDEIALTMKRRSEILAWQARDQAARPWAWQPLSG